MYLDYRLRTYNGTYSTACTIRVSCLGWEVTVFVGLAGDDDRILRTYFYTESAAFASFDIDNYFASHLNICAQFGLCSDS